MHLGEDMKIDLFGRAITIRKEYVVIGFIVLLMLFTLWGWYLKTNRIEVFSALDEPIQTKTIVANSVETKAKDEKYSVREEVQTISSGSADTTISPTGASVEESRNGISDNDARININTADIARLTTLSGIGEVKAKAIIAFRQQNGAFTSIEQIKNVKGIGQATFEKIKDRIMVENEILEADEQKQSEE